MNPIILSAIKSAAKTRLELGFNMFQPINIYDICEAINLTVRFININMEGLYIKSDGVKSSTILLSNERPISRRVFTCTHEFGHHIFGHGSKIDSLDYSNKYTIEQDKEELLVNAFAGSFLMPVAGIQVAMRKRNWNPNNLTPLNFYLLSSYFGVGYQTMIYHCRANNIIYFNKAKKLLKETPAKIFRENFSDNLKNTHYKYFDAHCNLSVVDLEVSNYLILPESHLVNSDYLIIVKKVGSNIIYQAIKRGISKVVFSDQNSNFSIRIENENYVGLSENRHLE